MTDPKPATVEVPVDQLQSWATQLTERPGVWIGDEMRALISRHESPIPTEPGWYLGDEGTTAVWIDEGGVFWGKVHTTVTDPERLAPFVRLSEDRPRVTVDEFVAVFESYGDDYDLETVHDLVALANGEETEISDALGVDQ